MQAFIWYLLKVGICIAAFWLLYRLLLSRDTFHSLNRAVLLASAVLAFLIPAGFVTLPAEASGPEPYTAIIPIGDEFRTDRIRTVPTPEPLAEPQAAETGQARIRRTPPAPPDAHRLPLLERCGGLAAAHAGLRHRNPPNGTRRRTDTTRQAYRARTHS